MESSSSRFSHTLDRVVFTAYFLGAVVPLLALAFVLERYAMPRIDDPLVTSGLVGAVFSVAFLTLGAFLILRRSTRRALAQMDRDNHRLSELIHVSGRLAETTHASEAGEQAARAAVAMMGARVCYAFTRETFGGPPVRISFAGDDAEKLAERYDDHLLAAARMVMSEGCPTLVGATAEHPALAAAPLPGEAAPFGALVAVAAPSSSSFSTDALQPLRVLGGLAAVALQSADLRDAQRNFFVHVTELLVTALDSHLGYHAGHGARVAQYANRIGRSLGLDERRLQRLHFGALLHDIGMLRIERDRVDRRRAMRHSQLGARMLGPIRVWADLAPIVHHHHEWWDGSGYPDALSGEAIPLEARIVAVCDAYDSMTSDSSYREPLSQEAALHEIEAGAGRQFDPDVARTFVSLMRD